MVDALRGDAARHELRTMNKSQAPNIFEIGKTHRPAQPSEAEIQSTLALFQQGRFADTEQQALRLTKLYPQNSFGWKILGVVLRCTNRLADSLKPMQTACKLAPRDHEAFNNLGSTLQALGDTRHAEPCYRHAIEQNPKYETAVANLAHMLFSLNRRDEALPLFERKLALTPDDDYVRHMVSFLRGDQTDRATAEYVTRTFDEYAQTFETHLQKGLQYDVPQRLAELIAQSGQAPAGQWRALDLGCGTGLVGEAIRAQCGELVGIDLSERMLDKAREKNIYQALICSDLLPAMQAEPAASFDVVTSADVFIYIGKIDEIVQQARRVLRGGGLMAFSVEDIDAAATGQPEYQLKSSSGRYGQSAAYLNRLASENGFKVLSMQDCVLRKEEDVPMHGKLVLWQA